MAAWGEQVNIINTQKNPKVSVIIPFFNSEKYLQKCVDSISGQSYSELEILLIDDGSVDNSVLIADKLAASDERIRVIRKEHRGVSAARNAGVEEASGAYILFVDSDDWMSLTIIERMVSRMLQNDTDLVTCELAFSDGTEPAVSGKQPYSEKTYTREEYLRIFFRIDSNEWIHFPVGKLYKKEKLPLPLYPEDIRVGEDVMGTYRALLQVEKIVRIFEVGYYYYNNPQSVTMRFSEKDFDLLRVWDQVVSMTEGHEPDHSYAIINRDRANFTLLFRLTTEVPAREIKEKYSKQQQELRTDLQKCEKELLNSPIVASRKTLIRLLCHCYPLMAAAGNLYVTYKKARGKAPGMTRRKLS